MIKLSVHKKLQCHFSTRIITMINSIKKNKIGIIFLKNIIYVALRKAENEEYKSWLLF